MNDITHATRTTHGPGITDTNPDDGAPIVPAWLRAAELEYEAQLRDDSVALGVEALAAWDLAEEQACAVNELLDELGIEPIAPAHATPDPHAWLKPAVLTLPDPVEERWGVEAGHDGNGPVLYARDWEHSSNVLPAGELRQRADVARVMLRGGLPPEPPARDLHTEALNALARLSADEMGAGDYAIAGRLGALVLAVLHTAEMLAPAHRR